jgi:hypothetical protein
MPTIRYKSRRRGSGPVIELDAFQEWALLFGHLDGTVLLSRWPADDPEPWAAAWDCHGERLLAEWIEKHPGSRPWPWWIFEHCQERPIANPMRPDVEAGLRDRARFGYLHTTILHGHGAPPGVMLPLQEPEVDYLDRNDLLTPREREVLGL